MHVCILVTSNVISDPRAQKEALIATDNGMKVTVIGRKDYEHDQSPLQQRPYDVILIPIIRRDQDGLIRRIIERTRLIIELYKYCVRLHPDMIHATNLDVLPPAFYAGRKLGIPVIYDSYEIWTEVGRIAEHQLLKQMVSRYEKYLIKRVNAVISVSNGCADVLAEKYKIARPEVIRNCPYSFPQRDSIIRNNGFEVLYHGGFTVHRALEEFCLTASELPDDVTLVLRGYGPLESDLRRLVDEKQLNNRIRFDTPVAVNEVCAAAARSHVGIALTKPVYISFKYSLPNKVLEYVQAGLPMILSGIPEHRSIVERFGIGLILDAVTPTSIAQAIIKLKNDEQLYQQLRENVLRAAQELCWEKEGLKLIDIYKRIGSSL